MDKQNMPEDEELYALLDTALQDETISVSEELIQKTLRRAKEETVAAPQKKKFGCRAILPYSGMVAAAALVLILGGRVIAGRGGFTSEFAAENSGSAIQKADQIAYEGKSGGNDFVKAAPESDSNSCSMADGFNGKKWFQENGESKGREETANASNDVPVTAADQNFQAEQEGVRLTCGEKYFFSEELLRTAENTGYRLQSYGAVTWLAEEGTGVDWNTELTEYLKENGDEAFAAAGTIFVGIAGDNQLIVWAEDDVKAAVFLETERGDFWAVMGDTLQIMQ